MPLATHGGQRRSVRTLWQAPDLQGSTGQGWKPNNAQGFNPSNGNPPGNAEPGSNVTLIILHLATDRSDHRWRRGNPRSFTPGLHHQRHRGSRDRERRRRQHQRAGHLTVGFAAADPAGDPSNARSAISGTATPATSIIYRN